MLSLSNSPPQDDRRHSLQIVRVPAGKAYRAIVTSDDLVGTNTHYWGGRTVPCTVEGCEPCENQMPWRWHGYVSILEAGTKRHLLLELTAQASEQLVQYRKCRGTTRGALLDCTRARNKPNGRVFINVSPADLEKIQIPSAPDVPRALCLLWALPFSDLEPTNEANNRISHWVSGEAASLRDGLPKAKRNGKLPVA